MAQRTRQASLPGMDEAEVAGGQGVRGQPAEAERNAPKVGTPQPAGDEPGSLRIRLARFQSAIRDRAIHCKEPGGPRIRLASPPVPGLAGKIVYVIDANSLIFQVFHAMPEMTSPAGEPVSAVFGFARDMLYLLEQKKPDYLFVAFDRPRADVSPRAVRRLQGPARRNAGRPGAAVSGRSSRLLAALGMPVSTWNRFEADDILATIAHQTERARGASASWSPATRTAGN